MTHSMTNAAALRDRAAGFREIAKEYDPAAARSLYETAEGLERQAAEVERNGRERRQPRRTLREEFLLPKGRVFGRALPTG
jgi:hypothetical protein